MDIITEFFLDYGYFGMFVASFLAGSVFPFSSETVMGALFLAGLNEWLLMLWATIGNTLGGLFNYFVGRFGNELWVYRLFKVKEKNMKRAQTLVHRYGVWMGLFSWLPILGSVITIVMGLLHLNIWKSATTMFAGKCLRYVILSVIFSIL